MPWQTLVERRNRLADLLGDPRLLLFDCRYELARPDAGREAYLRGHLPGAVHADLHHDLAAPTTPTQRPPSAARPQDFAARLRHWGVDDDSLLVAYDDANGMWASRFWWMPRSGSVTRTSPCWTAACVAGCSSACRRRRTAGAARPAGNFVGTSRCRRRASTRTRAGRCTAIRGAECSMRARAERYRGEVEPIDPVAGHVPGALNHPSVGRRRCGRPVPAARRSWRSAFAAALGGRRPADTITMCGSGVTACHLLLAMEHAGLPGARLYAGSWSEWSRDPSRPVARGAATLTGSQPPQCLTRGPASAIVPRLFSAGLNAGADQQWKTPNARPATPAPGTSRTRSTSTASTPGATATSASTPPATSSCVPTGPRAARSTCTRSSRGLAARDLVDAGRRALLGHPASPPDAAARRVRHRDRRERLHAAAIARCSRSR